MTAFFSRVPFSMSPSRAPYAQDYQQRFHGIGASAPIVSACATYSSLDFFLARSRGRVSWWGWWRGRRPCVALASRPANFRRVSYLLILQASAVEEAAEEVVVQAWLRLRLTACLVEVVKFAGSCSESSSPGLRSP